MLSKKKLITIPTARDFYTPGAQGCDRQAMKPLGKFTAVKLAVATLIDITALLDGYINK